MINLYTMAYIYKITNIINNKVYIGQTSLTPELRFKKHKKCYKSNGCPKLYRAFRKYGRNKFVIETICETNNPDKDEQFWIQYYDSVNNGYNITYGGKGGTTLDINCENKVLKIYEQTKSIHKTNKILGYSREYISNILLKNNIQYKKPVIKKINEQAIIQLYKKYKNIKQISQQLNISEATIRKYLKKNNIEIFNHKNDRYIYIMCDINTQQEIKRFNNLCEIKLFLNASTPAYISRINRVINGERNSYMGYYWKKIEK